MFVSSQDYGTFSGFPNFELKIPQRLLSEKMGLTDASNITPKYARAPPFPFCSFSPCKARW
jgi:hypothetical protein